VATTAHSAQLPCIFINSDGKARIVSVPDIEIFEDVAEKREALDHAGLPPVPFDVEILKSVLRNPETWKPSVTATEVTTFEITDESSI